ncbi:MAG TPA: ankyrin repeat domain-containing protein [Gemmatimonadaceae bacterium]|jgi:ankyrin repeat protein
MSEPIDGSAPKALALPDNPNAHWLRKQAKRRLRELRLADASTTLSTAQFTLAKAYGFPSWRALIAHVNSLTVRGQLFDAARTGELDTLNALLDAHPERLRARDEPYAHTLLHVAARHGQLAVVELLLARGLDVNAREQGDNTCAMHWGAAGGHLHVVQRLADAGGDVVGSGDDHELEVIGWATCWHGCDDTAHRAVAQFLISRGARHHIFSAVALSLENEVRAIVSADVSALNRRMSRNENNQTPLHFAVRMERTDMIALLLALGADPLAVDSSGQSVAFYATSKDVDQRVMERIHSLTTAELTSASRGDRPAHGGPMDLAAALSLGDWATGERLVRDNPALLERGGGVLHLMAKRNDVGALKWLLDHAVDPNALWTQYDSTVTALHMAAGGGNAEATQLLLDAGADPRIQDSRFASDSFGWAEHFGQTGTRKLLEAFPSAP